MTGARRLSWLLGVALLFAWAAQPVLAIGPSFVVVYGDPLKAPIVVKLGVEDIPSIRCLWATPPYRAKEDSIIPSGLDDRPYLKVAIFWGGYDPATIKPEDASQHARLYRATPSAPPVVVATGPWMNNPKPVPVPTALSGFIAGWALNAADQAYLRRLGIPPSF